MAKDKIPTFEDLYGGAVEGPGSPAKQIARDNYNQIKASIAEIVSVEALATVSAVVAGAIAFWRNAGFGIPVLAKMVDGSVNLIFQNQKVNWPQMAAAGDDRKLPYMTHGDATYLFTTPGDLFRRLNEQQEPLSQEMIKKYV